MPSFTAFNFISLSLCSIELYRASAGRRRLHVACDAEGADIEISGKLSRNFLLQSATDSSFDSAHAAFFWDFKKPAAERPVSFPHIRDLRAGHNCPWCQYIARINFFLPFSLPLDLGGGGERANEERKEAEGLTDSWRSKRTGLADENLQLI